MCGIFGYVGKKDAVSVCLGGLEKLEYRGYDSSGIAGVQQGKIFSCKEVGKIAKLKEKVRLQDLNLDVIIGHTRWATHGEPSHKNAHPHLDHQSTLALVHNGIIENYTTLRQALKEKGVVFHTDTDTEVFAQLVAYHYEKDLLKAVWTSLRQIKGSYAIALIHKDYPHDLIALCRESPLAVGFDDARSEIFVASDASAFLGKDLNVFFLKNEEIVHISRSSIDVYDANMRKIEKTSERFTSQMDPMNKEGYDHFMLKEIHEQPKTIETAFSARLNEKLGTVAFENIGFSPNELRAIRHILIIACGSSWHAGMIGAALLEDMVHVPAQAEIASELRFRNPLISSETLVIAISQSGETADTIAAVRETKAKGAKVLSICNVKNSTLIRESHGYILLNAGPEICVCSTKAFTSQVTVLFLFALFMARLRHMDKEEGQRLIAELKQIPSKVQTILHQEEAIRSLAQKYANYEHFFFLGRRYMHPTSLEAALKLKEISYLNATGYPAGEMKHGPIALLHSSFPVVSLCSNRQTFEKMVGSLMEVKARKAPLLVFAPEEERDGKIRDIADDLFFLPSTEDGLSPLLSIVPLQLLAYHIALLLGREIDQPRNLAKSVTVE